VESIQTTESHEDILRLIEGIEHLPTPPVVFSQINRVLNNPDASVYDVAKIIAEDPGMSARILRMANSAYYALPQPVGSIRQAVVILGLQAVRALVLSTAVVETFSGYDANPKFQDIFWRHSLATASAGRVLLGRQSGNRIVPAGEEGFSAGLLHDIGKLILVFHLPDLKAQADAHPHSRVVDDHFIEDEVIGSTHAAIGALLSTRWKLPEPLSAAIAHHHDLRVDKPEHLHLARVTHLADYLAHRVADPVPDREKVLPIIDWDVAAEFGLSEDAMPDIETLVRDEFGRSETFLEMARHCQ
jgi:HD-like signal output (HDOD) protein